jgi:hypothetical protein
MAETPQPAAPPHVPVLIETSKSVAYLVTTALAAAFNILVLLVISFSVMPQVNRLPEDIERARESILINHRLLEQGTHELKEHRLTIERLNRLLDIAEARAKAAAEKKGKK